jgi:hypothetical protein
MHPACARAFATIIAIRMLPEDAIHERRWDQRDQPHNRIPNLPRSGSMLARSEIETFRHSLVYTQYEHLPPERTAVRARCFAQGQASDVALLTVSWAKTLWVTLILIENAGNIIALASKGPHLPSKLVAH